MLTGMIMQSLDENLEVSGTHFFFNLYFMIIFLANIIFIFSEKRVFNESMISYFRLASSYTFHSNHQKHSLQHTLLSASQFFVVYYDLPRFVDQSFDHGTLHSANYQTNRHLNKKYTFI